MKKAKIFLGCLLIFISCNSRKENSVTEDVVVICGKITHPTDLFLIVFEDTVKVTGEGEFYIKRKINKSGYYKLSYNNEYTDLYVENGDSLYVTFDTEQFDETMHYSGRGSEKNNYLAATILNHEKEMQLAKSLYTLSSDSFKIKVDSIKTARLSLLKKFSDSSPLPEKFRKYEEGKIVYSWASSLIKYPFFYEFYKKTKPSHISADYYSFLKSITIEDTTLLGIQEYDEFLDRYITYLIDLKYKSDTSLKGPYMVVSYNVIKENLKNQKILERLLFNAILYGMEDAGINEKTEKVVQDFKQFCKDQKMIKEIQEEYDRWLTLKEGNPAPEVKCLNEKGDTVLLSSFRGKYVYIDVWAIWCGPCRMEIPYFEKLKDKYKNKNIHFLSISVDENTEGWKKFIKEKSMKGNQFIAIGNFDSDIARGYNIRGIPRFILIDKEGKILDANAPRPSSNEIHKVLAGLL
jgi:thiol-disulfide isomerase/thioredoxin